MIIYLKIMASVIKILMYLSQFPKSKNTNSFHIWIYLDKYALWQNSSTFFFFNFEIPPPMILSSLVFLYDSYEQDKKWYSFNLLNSYI